MSDRVPKSWSVETLGALCKFTGGSAFKEIYQGKSHGDYPFIKVSDMNLEGNQKFITYANNWIDQETLKSAKAKTFPRKAVVFAKVGAALLLNRRRILTRDTVIDNNMMAAIPHADDNNFLYYLLQDIDFGTFVQSGAVPSINQSQLEEIPIVVPPLQEQQKIASILTAVDEVIASTTAQINKLKDLKTGMMQELLTKGIGHTEFKDSPVGRIPKEWKFVRFDEVVTKVGSGITPSGGSAVYTTTGVPFVRSQNVYQDGLRWDDVCFISKEQHQKMKNSQLKPRDVLLNITGASIGRCYYLPDQFGEGNVNQHVCIIRCEHAQIQHIYLAHFINSDFGQKQIMNLQAGGNREGLNFQQIRAMELPLPPLDEQLEISNVILSIESNISKRTAKLNSLCRLKKSLMHDLLTGKVRVVSP